MRSIFIETNGFIYNKSPNTHTIQVTTLPKWQRFIYMQNEVARYFSATLLEDEHSLSSATTQYQTINTEL